MYLLWLGLKIFALAMVVFVIGFAACAVMDWRLHRKLARERYEQTNTEGWCRFLDWIILRPVRIPEPRRRAKMQPRITTWTAVIAVLFLAAVIYGVMRCF